MTYVSSCQIQVIKASPPESRTDAQSAGREKMTMPIEQIEKL